MLKRFQKYFKNILFISKIIFSSENTSIQNFASFFGAHRCLKYLDTLPNYIILSKEKDMIIRSSQLCNYRETLNLLFQFQIAGDIHPEDFKISNNKNDMDFYITCIKFHRYSLFLREAAPTNLEVYYQKIINSDNVFAFYQMLLIGKLTFESTYLFLQKPIPQHYFIYFSKFSQIWKRKLDYTSDLIDLIWNFQ